MGSKIVGKTKNARPLLDIWARENTIVPKEHIKKQGNWQQSHNCGCEHIILVVPHRSPTQREKLVRLAAVHGSLAANLPAWLKKGPRSNVLVNGMLSGVARFVSDLFWFNSEALIHFSRDYLLAFLVVP